MKKIKYQEFGVCEQCAKSPAIHRNFCGKTLCSECAEKEFKKYLQKLVAAVVTILIIGLILL